ncbi:TPA: hypothetical protein ACIJ1B_001714 [Escherichia coli]
MMCWRGKNIVDVLEREKHRWCAGAGKTSLVCWRGKNIVGVLEWEKHRWCAGVGKTSLMCWRGKNIVDVLEREKHRGVLEWEIVVGIRDGVIPVCCRGNRDVLWWDAIL